MSRALRAAVTGGGGFLGSSIVSLLLEEGYAVRSYSRHTYPALTARGVECVTGDLGDADALRDGLRDADVVFHVAAKAAIWGDYAEFYAVNVAGTRNVIDACLRNGVRKLVYTSTPSVAFAGHDERNTNEDAPYPRKYLAHYPRTKAEAERMVLAANGSELATVALRPHLIWGPGDNNLFPKLRQRHLAKRLMFIGRGENLIDSVFVDNAAQAHLDAAKRLEPGSAAAGHAYFISQGDPRPIASLINELLRAAGLPPVRKSIPLPVAYAAGCVFETIYRVFGIAADPPLTRFFALQMARDHYFDISAARRDLGYAPAIGIEEGMRRFQLALSS